MWEVSFVDSLQTNVVDFLMTTLEQDAAHLQDIIEERTGQLVVEKAKVESLLHNLLPP